MESILAYPGGQREPVILPGPPAPGVDSLIAYAKGCYVRGEVDIDEFERGVQAILEGRSQEIGWLPLFERPAPDAMRSVPG